MDRFLDELQVKYIIAIDMILVWIFDHIIPNIIIYDTVNATLKYCAPSIPILSVVSEMRKRGLFEYYAIMHMINSVINERKNAAKMDSISISEVLEQFKRKI